MAPRGAAWPEAWSAVSRLAPAGRQEKPVVTVIVVRSDCGSANHRSAERAAGNCSPSVAEARREADGQDYKSRGAQSAALLARAAAEPLDEREGGLGPRCAGIGDRRFGRRRCQVPLGEPTAERGRRGAAGALGKSGPGIAGPHAVWVTEGWISVTAPEPFLTLYGSVGAFQTRCCPVTSETAAQALLEPRRSIVRERGVGWGQQAGLSAVLPSEEVLGTSASRLAMGGNSLLQPRQADCASSFPRSEVLQHALSSELL